MFGSGKGSGLTSRRPPQIQSVKTWRKRKETVKDTFRYAYGAYEKAAFGHDELKPWANSSVDKLVPFILFPITIRNAVAVVC